MTAAREGTNALGACHFNCCGCHTIFSYFSNCRCSFLPLFFSVRSRWAAATAMANCGAFVCRLVRQFGSATQIAVGQVRVCVHECVCLVECPKKQTMKYAHKHMHIVTGRFVQRALFAIFILFYDPAAAAVTPPPPHNSVSLNIQRQLCHNCSYRGVVEGGGEEPV